MSEWISVKDKLPEDKKEVNTKVDDESGIRNEQTLLINKGLWWFPDESMYVYYTPTHWMPLQPEEP